MGTRALDFSPREWTKRAKNNIQQHDAPVLGQGPSGSPGTRGGKYICPNIFALDQICLPCTNSSRSKYIRSRPNTLAPFKQQMLALCTKTICPLEQART